jgi:endo-1,4-beta-xylanase
MKCKSGQRKINLRLIILLFLFPATMNISAQDSSLEESIEKYRKGEFIVKVQPGDKVSVEQLSHEFWFGCAISNGLVENYWKDEDKEMFKEKFLENFNSAVTENALKWGNMERRKGQVNYGVVDGILEWTDEAGLPLRGHNLFWGVPRWVQDWVKELDEDELLKTVKNRAETIAARYKGRFVEYDLNNEMIHGNYYEEKLGPDITKRMAEWVHHADPEAVLYLNDYDVLTGNVLDRYMEHIRTLLQQGASIAGIGVQGHLHGDTFDRNELKRALDSLAQFGLPIRITEFNMPGQRSEFYQNRNLKMNPEGEEQKAREIVDYYRICFAHPAVEGILMWGFWEGANWIPVSSLYKRDWTPTPALKAYQDLIFKEWWTEETGTANSEGIFSVPAFYGKYKVTVNGKSREIDLKKSEGKATVDWK